MRIYEYDGPEPAVISDARVSGSAIHHCMFGSKIYVSIKDSAVDSIMAVIPSLKELNGANFGSDLKDLFYRIRDASPAVAAIRNDAVAAIIENPGLYNVIVLLVYELVFKKEDENTEKIKQKLLEVYTESCRKAIEIGF